MGGSTYRSRLNLAWSASFSNPRGSQNPRGGCTPSSFSNNDIFLWTGVSGDTLLFKYGWMQLLSLPMLQGLEASYSVMFKFVKKIKVTIPSSVRIGNLPFLVSWKLTLHTKIKHSIFWIFWFHKKLYWQLLDRPYHLIWVAFLRQSVILFLNSSSRRRRLYIKHVVIVCVCHYELCFSSYLRINKSLF